MIPYILAIDAGTTSSRAIVFDKDTKKIEKLEFQITSTKYKSENYAEYVLNDAQDIDKLC